MSTWFDRLLCKIGLHDWKNVPPPQETIDACVKQGGWALFALPFAGSTVCKNCGKERDE